MVNPASAPAADLDGIGLVQKFAGNSYATGGMAIATSALPGIWYCLAHGLAWPARILAGVQVTVILASWAVVQFPVLVKVKGGPDLTIHNAHAPSATLDQLGWALLAGSVFILPALFWLLRVFKAEQPVRTDGD
jgi:cytochrome d ubiquinol oxidase subunit II